MRTSSLIRKNYVSRANHIPGRADFIEGLQVIADIQMYRPTTGVHISSYSNELPYLT